MQRFEVGSGYVTVSGSRIDLERERLHAVRQLYRRNKPLSAVLFLCVFYIGAMALVRPDLFPWRFALAVSAAAAAVLGWRYARTRWLTGATRESTIDRDAVELAIHSEGGPISRPEIVVVYVRDGERRLRSFTFPYRFLDGDDDFRAAKRAFEREGIELRSVEEVERAADAA